MDFSRTALGRVCPACKKVHPFHEPHTCDNGRVDPPVGDDPHAMVGALIGDRFEIEAFLQGGGMGVVYRARHRILGKPVAIKLLRETQDPTAQQRFLLEAKSACTIGHPNIVDITDYGILEDGRPYLVMEYLVGRALDHLLLHGPLEPARACRIARQVALGLQAVHDKGIVHRDLKPGNVFIVDHDGEDFAKILDFGIAKVLTGERPTLSGGGEPAPPRMTQVGMVVGTPEYLSPEQAAGEPVDHHTDQYSLGCILYEMLTGELVFASETVSSLLRKHVTAPPVPPRLRRPGLAISDELEALVLRTLAKHADDRFPSMRELAAALQVEAERSGAAPSRGTTPPGLVVAPVLATPAAPATGPGGELVVDEDDVLTGRHERVRRWLPALLGGTVLLLLGALLYTLVLRPAVRPAPVPPPAPVQRPAPPPTTEALPAPPPPERAAPEQPDRRSKPGPKGPRRTGPSKSGKSVVRFKD